MEDEHWGGATDFQWHSFEDGITVNAVYCLSYTNCSGVVILKNSNPGIGSPVCHMGVTTGATCGVVTDPAYTYDSNPAPCPNDDPTTCPTGTWIRLGGANLACAGGDSGGPAYQGSVAYGLVKANISEGVAPGQCRALIIMPIGRVTDAGLVIL